LLPPPRSGSEGDVTRFLTDHAGLEVLPLEDCLRRLASVPVGRIGFSADGEVVVFPVNHALSGQDVVFRTARGATLSAAEAGREVVFEADDYDPNSRSGWSVLVNGRAEAVYEDSEIKLLDELDLHPWADGCNRPFWVRIRPRSITGRLIPPASGEPGLRDISRPMRDTQLGDSGSGRSTPYGEVRTVYASNGMEVVRVSKLGEHIDEHWFWANEDDVIVVVQGQLKFEFADPDQPDRVLGVGDVLVLPARMRCRAYRWPREAGEATVFVAAYPVRSRPGAD
jgi:uncharacterized protein